MTAYARKAERGWVALDGPFTIDGVQYPADWPARAPAESAALGILPIEDANDAADGTRIVGSTIIGEVAPRHEWITAPIPIEEARAIMWDRVKRIREAKMNAGCDTPLGRVDTDDGDATQSRRKLNGAVTNALVAQIFGQPYSVDWTMADNGVVTHTGQQIIAAGVAVARHIAACQDRGTQLRRDIFAAANPFGVDLAGGWPA